MLGTDGDFTKCVTWRVVDAIVIIPDATNGTGVADAAEISAAAFNVHKALGSSGVVSASPAGVGTVLVKAAHKVFAAGKSNKV